jgi:Tfp pilus assembly protein PilZ
MGITKKGLEKRIHKRILYSGHIFFSARSGFFEGELKNYSKYGLFIKTSVDLTLGEFITVALPYMESKQIKLRGQILWQNSEGYGVEFVRERSNTSLQLLKIEAKSSLTQQM